MAEDTIVCPKCGNNIQLSEALTAQIRIEVGADFKARAQERDKEHEEVLRALESEHNEELKNKQAEVEKDAEKKAREAAEMDMKDLQTQLDEKTAEVKERREEELELRKRERQLTEKTEKADLELERRLAEEREKLKADAEDALREEHKLALKEKDTQLERVIKQLDEAKRKAEGKSQELQGEVLELELEDLLRAEFPMDEIEAVKKGARGADVIQHVRTKTGQEAGIILWETKRTKAWAGAWTTKLRDDQRRAKADLAVIVSDIVPDNIADFGPLDGVFVTTFKFVAGLAVLFRSELINVAQARTSLVDQSDKKAILYEYVLGTEFRQRVEVMVESYSTLLEDLASEKRAMERNWAKRETQLNRAMAGAAGMYGDLQGIIGASLPTVETLQLPAGEDTAED